MRHKIYLALLLAALICFSCAKKEETASDYLLRAEMAFEQGCDSVGYATIDSIHALFARSVDVRRRADTLKWTHQLVHCIEIAPRIDSDIDMWNDSLPKLLPKFVLIKDTLYSEIGRFEHVLLKTECNTSRCYVKPSVDEHGKIYFTAFYVGVKTLHTGLRATCDSASVECHISAENYVHAFDDDGVHHEIMEFDAKQLNGLDRFISHNSTQNIKITYLGEKPYIYNLNEREREIFRSTYLLAEALSNISQLYDNQLRNSQKIEMLKQRLHK